MRFAAKTRRWTDRTYGHVTTKFSCIDKLNISINSNVGSSRERELHY